MFKRLFIAAASAFLLGQALVIGMQMVQGRSVFLPTEASRRADQFREVLQLVNRHYVREPDASLDKLSNTALEGMLRSLDPHSEFLSRNEYQSFRVETSQEFGGIGVQIEMRDQRLTVVAPIAGTPGERAGLLRGDQIVKVGDQTIEGLSLDESLIQLRGRPGTMVALTVFRPGTGETLQKEIVREVVNVESVRDRRMLGDDIGYVRVVQFGERTGEEFRAALADLESKGARALIIDVRDNPGGLLEAVVSVAEPFFEKGELIVYTQGRDAESRENIAARRNGPRRAWPLAVLINSGSASASEILAGALRDTGRAVLVGEKSFGKGSVQTILPLRRGGEAIRLTTALFHLPSGAVINGKGIEPHIAVTLTADEDRRLAVQRSRLGLMTVEEFREQFEFDPIEDRQLTAAIDALRGVFVVAALGGGASSGAAPEVLR